MIRHLTSGTDAAGMALFDPLAAREALAGRADVTEDEVVAAADAGALLYWYTAADGAFTIGLYVDEPVPADLRSRAEHGRAGLLVQVPSGRLAFAGVEALQDLRADPAGEPFLDLPAGDYEAEAFEVGWSAADDRAYEAALRADAGAWPVRLSNALGMATVLALMVTLATAIPAFVMLVARPARFFQSLAWLGPTYLLGWAAIFGLWRLPAIRRVQAARDRLDATRPGAVVALRRLPEGAEGPTSGGAFGEGYGA